MFIKHLLKLIQLQKLFTHLNSYFMKLLIFLFMLSLVNITYAQKQGMFVRVYDLKGKKIYKGNVYSTTDSSLLLVVKSQFLTVPVSNIGHIKTKHSFGNNLLIGSAIGATTFAILGAATAEPEDEFLGYSAGEGAAAGALIGTAAGAAIGGLTVLFKNSKTFSINGDMNQWKKFKSFIETPHHRK